jgi:hypothetical protein
MILNIIISLIYNVVGGLLSKLPSVSTTNGFGAAVSTASGYLSALSVILPITTLLAILAFDIAFETGYLAFKVIYWIIRRFPTQS